MKWYTLPLSAHFHFSVVESVMLTDRPNNSADGHMLMCMPALTHALTPLANAPYSTPQEVGVWQAAEEQRERCVELCHLKLQGSRVALIWVTFWRGGIIKFGALEISYMRANTH